LKKTILVVFLLTASLYLFAQEATVEDLYLKVSAETRIIDSQAKSQSRNLKTMAIFVMKIVLDLGSVGEMETESMVLSEIIVAISKNTVADPELVVNMISRLMEVHGSARDHNFAYAFLVAVENISKNEIEIKNPKIFQLVSEMTLPDSGYIQVVTDKAKAVLKGIK